MMGGVQRLPYPDHCRILEAMFRGWTAEQLLQTADAPHGGASAQPEIAQLVEALRQGLAAPEPQAAWSRPLRSHAAGGTHVSTLPPRLSETMHAVEGDVAHDLARKLMRYIRVYSKTARPFKWKYTDVRRRILPC